ncbi:MAG: FtsB family cell division protein [Candidatus Chromulinivorax sp.]
MRYIWSKLLILCLAFQGAAFVVYYYFGPRGVLALQTLRMTKKTILDDCKRLIQENKLLREQIYAWQHDIFLQEKFAREKLALQKEGEIIFFKGK